VAVADPVEFEKLVDQLSEKAPPPPPETTQGFFGTRTPEQLMQTSRTPEQVVGEGIGGSIGTPTPSGLPQAPQGGQGDPVAAALNQFMGAQQAAPFQSTFAPLPGTPRGGGNVQVAGSPAGGTSGQVDPLDSLAKLIMGGR